MFSYINPPEKLAKDAANEAKALKEAFPLEIVGRLGKPGSWLRLHLANEGYFPFSPNLTSHLFFFHVSEPSAGKKRRQRHGNSSARSQANAPRTAKQTAMLRERQLTRMPSRWYDPWSVACVMCAIDVTGVFISIPSLYFPYSSVCVGERQSHKGGLSHARGRLPCSSQPHGKPFIKGACALTSPSSWMLPLSLLHQHPWPFHFTPTTYLRFKDGGQPRAGIQGTDEAHRGRR